MYRAVYADLQSGMSPADVTAKNGIPLKGVGNIMRRLESYPGSVTLAAAEQHTPSGNITGFPLVIRSFNAP